MEDCETIVEFSYYCIDNRSDACKLNISDVYLPQGGRVLLGIHVGGVPPSSTNKS